LSNVTTFTYELGDLIKVKDPLNRETQRILDAAGRLRNVTNPLGQKTLYTPDALDRITQLTDAINGATAFTYDANSNLLTVTDAKTQQTIYTYSNMNRTATRKDPLVNTETYTYDNNGNVATVTDRKSQVTTHTYDALNRKTKATFHDSTSTNYTYDAGNRITQVQEKDAGGTVTATITRTYDGLDRLTQEVTPQGQIDYTYDTASRRTSMTVAGQTAVNYTYDNANRLTTITQGTPTVTLAYDDADRRTSLTLPNTNSIVYAYTAASELTSLTYKQGGTTIGDLTYTYDAAGNRIKTGGSFARSGLPPALTTVSYNANNQQTTFGTNTITYDLNGNLATVTDAGVTTTYTWNARNQLTGISNTGFSASFTYDSFGRRTGKTVQGTTTNFVYDGLNPVQEKNGGTVTANLITGLGIDEFFQRTDGVGSRALLPEALGSTVALGDGTGTLQTQYTYEPFGSTSVTGQASASSYKYTGREDDDSGLYYYRNRYYHPRLQRFISEDPIRFRGGMDFYTYAGNSPINYRDPFGLRIVVQGNMGEYQQAIAYLSRDAGMANIIHDLDSSSTVYTVLFNHQDADAYDPGTHTIHWDPHSALRVRCSGTQSPALGLGHEMAHADVPWYWTLINWIPWPEYDNLEERRVIVGPETDAAHTLGEGTRTDHRGTTYRVPTPISR
jgi:RHS repeat-associated protein